MKAAEKRVRGEFTAQLEELKKEHEQTTKLNGVILDLKRYV